jgi:uncharacterized protein
MRSIFDANISGDLKCRTCMLMVTHACNLNCVYCYENHKDNQMMSFEMAKSAIMKEAGTVQRDERFERLEIDFMGGEPLMNFPLIQRVVEWLEAEPLPIPFICFATTNGTLLDDEKKAWFHQHRNIVWLGASYDGSTELQRKNRGATAENVDYDFFYEVWPRQGFKMTISKESLPCFAEGVLESQRKGYYLSASLAQGVDWDDKDACLYLEQLRKLSDTYIKEAELMPINLLIKPLFRLNDAEEQQESFCGTGRYMITYDIDGKSYGCHMFSPIVLGLDGALEMNKLLWESEEIATDLRCKDCFLKKYCPTCMGFNYHYRGNVAKRDFRWCKMVLAEVIAGCEFQIRKLSYKEILTKREAEYGQCALEAYSVLKSFSLDRTTAPFIRNTLLERG